jgi:hypothetical protein
LSGIASADPPPPGPQTTMDQDGTYAVGTDIVPGIYSSAGPVADGTCYWKRINGSDIVDNAMSRKPQVVSIEPADTAFKTDGCQPWQLTPDAAVPPTGGVSPQIAGAILGGIGNAINGGAGNGAPPPHP